MLGDLDVRQQQKLLGTRQMRPGYKEKEISVIE